MQWRNETGERRKRISLDLYRRVNVVKYGSFEGMSLLKKIGDKADLVVNFWVYMRKDIKYHQKVKRHEYNTFIDIMPLVATCPKKYQNVFVLKSQILKSYC